MEDEVIAIEYARLSFVVFTSALTREELDAAIGLGASKWSDPDLSGVRRHFLSGKPTAAWIWELEEPRDSPVEELLGKLCTQLEGGPGLLHDLLGPATHAVAKMTVAFPDGQGGFTLSPDILGRLSLLGIAFSLDMLD